MAYLRDEKENLEIDFPLEKIWAIIPEVIASLEWTVEEKDDLSHRIRVKTKPGFLSYSTVILVEVNAVNEKTSRMSLTAETPVTTITSIIDFGRTRDRIGQFVEALAKQMEKKK